MDDDLLMIPGPTNISYRVAEVMSRAQIGHKDPRFVKAFKEILELTRYIFVNYTGLPFVISGSGTIGMEAAVASLVEPEDKVLCCDTGYFGKKFVDLATIYGAKVSTLNFDIGKPVNIKILEEELSRGNYKVITITHVETSTGLINSIKDLLRITRKYGVYSIIDSVCGIGGCELVFDEIGADIVITCSQKVLAGPPGATLLAVSKKAMEAIENRKIPIKSYYLNLKKWLKFMEDPSIYLATPSIQILLAVREALLMVKEEGLENRFQRHKIIADAIRSGLEALNLQFVVEDGYRANTVTGFYVSDNKAKNVHSIMQNRYRIHLAEGLGELKGKILRIGHFGNISPRDVLTFLSSLELSLEISKGKRCRENNIKSAVFAALPHLLKLI